MAKGGSNQLRIIGGMWRGRKLQFADAEGLRPTTDRVRETLFNWLQGRLEGARCLDLFAGSGALGLEALSRGAAEVVLVERDRRVAQQLSANLALLGARNGQVICRDALEFLAGEAQGFDILFLDPPFRRNLLEPVMERLASTPWLKPGAFIYIELETEHPLPPLPQGWQLLRSKRAGQVGYHLLQAV